MNDYLCVVYAYTTTTTLFLFGIVYCFVGFIYTNFQTIREFIVLISRWRK